VFISCEHVQMIWYSSMSHNNNYKQYYNSFSRFEKRL